MDRNSLVLWEVDPFARIQIRIVKQMVPHVVEKVTDEGKRDNLLGQLSKKERNV